MIADEIGAEMLLLPGYLLSDFAPSDFFTDATCVPEFDRRVQELIGEVRSVYSGKILISGSQTVYDFPGLADYVGTTTYDIGVPDLPGDAPFRALIGDYARRFADRVDRIHDRWGKPVVLYTVHAPSKPRAGDEFGRLSQAAAYEAMFREVAKRPYVAGTFSWAYDMIGASEFATDGVRGRTAESVPAKWYDLLASGV